MTKLQTLARRLGALLLAGPAAALRWVNQPVTAAHLVVIAMLLGSPWALAAVRDRLNDPLDIFNESALRSPGEVQFNRWTVSVLSASTLLTTLTSASELHVKNLTTSDLCLNVVESDETCTASCTTADYVLEQGEAVTLRLPRKEGPEGAFGQVCGILGTATAAVHSIQRN
jgi:hypothetical protein